MTYQARRDFLEDLALDPPAATGDFAGPPVLDEDWLVLSTILDRSERVVRGRGAAELAAAADAPVVDVAARLRAMW